MSIGEKSNSKSSKVIGILWYFISALFPALSSFIIFSLATRQISPSQLGSVSLALTITIFLISLCGSGFGDALIQRKDINKKHVSSVFCLLLILSVSLYTFSLLFVYTIPLESFDPLFKTAYVLFGIKLILDVCATLPLSLLTRQMEFKKIGIRTMVCSAGATLACIPILYLGGGVWAIVFSQITSSIISFIILWSSSHIKPNLKFCIESFNDVKSFGIKTTLAKIVSSMNLDNLVIGAFGNLHTLGVYTFSRRICSVFTDVIAGAMSNVSYPLYSSLQHDKVRLNEVFLKTTFVSTLISLPAFTGLFLLSDYIVPLIFGSQWAVAVFAIKCCCFIGFISCIGVLQLSLIKGLGRTGWILKYQLFQQITTGILAYVFSDFGANAVMLAITIKTYIVWPYTIFYVSKILNLNVLIHYLKSLSKPIFATAIMVLIFHLMGYFFPSMKENVIFYIVVQIFCCALSYILLVLAISRKDISEMISTFKTKKS
ncbi:oligosaccharide flippase family protein [Erwinia sp. S43]|uniref:oligosaccharide flippase family protein n=1 Tax=Erwinia sp. S43 TaxID=2769339 RepID=UPI00190DC48B|nr:oligosaccharide flippase family protein [Erwinia sp. S43]MBK0033753.1 oligosaccharide flippase family protein [Erwinia sp. S43]